jgi:hypothetical protein
MRMSFQQRLHVTPQFGLTIAIAGTSCCHRLLAAR